MRFLDYINDSVQPEHRSTYNILDDIYRKEAVKGFVETLKKNCAQFIKDTKGIDLTMCRYVKNPVVGMHKFTPRVDRKPMDTPQWMHDYLDSLFLKKFGWKARSEGVFAVAVKNDKVGYFGSYYPMFPVGDYHYVWSPKVTDLYTTISDEVNDFDVRDWRHLTEFPEENKRFKAAIDKLMRTYKDNNLKAYLNSQPPEREIMIKCEAYYLVETSLGTDIINGVYG